MAPSTLDTIDETIEEGHSLAFFHHNKVLPEAKKREDDTKTERPTSSTPTRTKAPPSSKVENCRKRCIISTAAVFAIAAVTALVTAFKMPYNESPPKEQMEHHDRGSWSQDFNVDDFEEGEDTKPPTDKPTKSPTLTVNDAASATVALPLPSIISTSTPTLEPTSSPSFSPSIVTVSDPKEDCQTPTEPDEEGYFYWHGAPLLEYGESLASDEEPGQRIEIHVQFYKVCSAPDNADADAEPETLLGRLIDIWQPNAAGFFDNAQYDLRGGYETTNEGTIIIRSVLPGRNGYGYLRRMYFKVWKNMISNINSGFSDTGITYAEELTSTWYFGDDEEELMMLESEYGGRVIRLDQENVGYVNVYIDVEADVFHISSVSRKRRNDLFE